MSTNAKNSSQSYVHMVIWYNLLKTAFKAQSASWWPGTCLWFAVGTETSLLSTASKPVPCHIPPRRLLAQRLNGQYVKLTAYLHPLQRLRICGPPVPLLLNSLVHNYAQGHLYEVNLIWQPKQKRQFPVCLNTAFL